MSVIRLIQTHLSPRRSIESDSNTRDFKHFQNADGTNYISGRIAY